MSPSAHRLLVDIRDLVSGLRFVVTMLLITATAVVFSVIFGPSLQVVLALAGLAASHFLLELWRRRPRR